MLLFQNSNKQRLIIILPLLLLLAVNTVLAEQPEILREGTIAPKATLKDLQGTDRVFPVVNEWNIIFFWSLFCHTCLDEIPLLVEETRKINHVSCKSFFISLDTEKMKKALQNYLKKRNLECDLLLEETASNSYKTADKWGVKTTPSTFLIDPSGKIVFSKEGPFDSEEIFGILRKAEGACTHDAPTHPTTADPMVKSAGQPGAAFSDNATETAICSETIRIKK